MTDRCVQVLCLIWTEKIQPRVKSELRKQPILWHSFGISNSSLANKNNHVLLYRSCLVSFFICMRAISRYNPSGAYIMEDFLRYEFGGRGIYLEGLIFGILRYFNCVYFTALTSFSMRHTCNPPVKNRFWNQFSAGNRVRLNPIILCPSK